MKIKSEFWELIINGEKTVELIKVSKFDEKLFNSNFENGRLKIPLSIGSITINGYSIVKNPFIEKLPINGFNIVSGHTYTYDVRKKLNKLFNLNFDQTYWMVTYWEYLKEYFKNEEEILVLNIESWTDNND